MEDNLCCPKEAKRSKRRYDQKVRCSKFDVGDIVMVRQKGFTGKHKVVDRWEKDYYEVISQKLKGGIPVFVIKVWERIRGKECYTETCCIL